MPSADSLYSLRPLRIAFTYDSKSEWLALGYSVDQCAKLDSDEAIEQVAMSLRKIGDVEMVGGLKSLTKIVATSKPDWDIVFNICEGLGSLGREAQVPALLEGWGIPFTFSDSATMALCLDKAKTKVSKSIAPLLTPVFRWSWSTTVFPSHLSPASHPEICALHYLS